MLVASSFAYVINGESSTGHAGQPASVAPLVAFLSDDIIEMYRIGKGNLLLRFRKGGEITISEDEFEYESYTIYLGEGDMIVV